MHIEIDQALFVDPTQDETRILVRLLMKAAEAGFPGPLVRLDPPYQGAGQSGPVDAWLRLRGAEEAEEIHRLLGDCQLRGSQLAPWRLSDSAPLPRWQLGSADEIRVERRAQSDWVRRALTAQDALDLLREPVHLLLENERTDLAFLSALAGPTDGGTLAALLDEPDRVQILHAAGGEGRKWLEGLLEEPCARSYRRLLRTFVVFDRDAGEQDAREPASEARRLCETCAEIFTRLQIRLPFVCLLRREIESYVPDLGLEKEAPASLGRFVETVQAWRADPDRRAWVWSLDLKKGLLGDLVAQLDKVARDELKQGRRALGAQHLKAPFSGLAAEEIAALRQGLGERLGSALRRRSPPTWLADIPAEYDRGPDDQAPRQALVRALFARM